jgi:hypothetical protein
MSSLGGGKSWAAKMYLNALKNKKGTSRNVREGYFRGKINSQFMRGSRRGSLRPLRDEPFWFIYTDELPKLNPSNFRKFYQGEFK